VIPTCHEPRPCRQSKIQKLSRRDTVEDAQSDLAPHLKRAPASQLLKILIRQPTTFRISTTVTTIAAVLYALVVEAAKWKVLLGDTDDVGIQGG
jgi:hypothetical protein